MRGLLKQNPGLTSRFPTEVNFADYSPSELMLIARSMLEGQGLHLGKRSLVRPLLAACLYGLLLCVFRASLSLKHIHTTYGSISNSFEYLLLVLLPFHFFQIPEPNRHLRRSSTE
jgi:hypothetical protein